MLVVHNGWSWRYPIGHDYGVVRCKACGTVYLRNFWQSRIDWSGDDDEYTESITIISLADLAQLLLELEQLPETSPHERREPFPGAVEVARQFGDQELISLIRSHAVPRTCEQCDRRMTVTGDESLVWCRWCRADSFTSGWFDWAIDREWKAGEELLSRFQVREVLGSGGMSDVYRVYHLEWGVEFAVKSPRSEVVADTWLKPVEAWLSLRPHPHVVTCHFVRSLGGIPRVFTEFVDGGTLAQWLGDGRLYAGGEGHALERILAVAAGTAGGLGHLHDENLLHSGLGSPSVLMTSEGAAKVGGMSLLTRGVPDELTEETLGTPVGMRPPYASPEQTDVVAQAQSGAGVEDRPVVTQRSDVWSWAVTVLEMFVGERTWHFGQAAPAVLEAYLEEGPAREGPPPMPEPVADLLRRCLQGDPLDRTGSMAEVAAEVGRIRSTQRAVQDSPERRTAGRLSPRVEIPGYELGRLLGTHGMARVYEATRRSDGQAVAIEVVQSAEPDAHVGRLYTRAVDLVGDLDHVNLVRVLDHGSVAGHSYLVTEYWSGETVASLIDRSGGRLTIAQATPIMLGALDGLAHLHEHGIVHRDLKPGNIWLTEDGAVPKLTSFDLAKRYDDAGAENDDEREGMVAGTPVFMPREQVINFPYVKPVSDVWAMAATFYSMLTGQYPRDFTSGHNPINVILNEPVIPIQERDPEILPRLATVIDRALSDDVAERYQDATEFREALEGALHVEPETTVTSRPVHASALSPEAPDGDDRSEDQDPVAALIKLLKERRGESKGRTPVVTVPGYEIERELHRGGRGVLYRAHRVDDGKVVALRIVFGHEFDKSWSPQRFSRGLDLWRRLDHPNCVRIVDDRSDTEPVYVAMEYCAGGSVQELMDRTDGRLSLRRAIPLMLGALAGLSQVHDQGLVYAEAATDKLLLGEKGVLKLAPFDFALAGEAAEPSSIEDVPSLRVSPVAFLPREAVLHHGCREPASDVWAMAATFYTMLTGQYPRDFVRGKDPINIVLDEPVIPIRERDPSIPERLAEVVDRALSEDLAERYEDAAEFRVALAEVV